MRVRPLTGGRLTDTSRPPVTAVRVAEIACQQILAKLQVLSDQRASAIRTEGRLEHGTSTAGLRTRATQAMPVKSGRYADSAIPDGVSDRASSDHAPSKQLSLFYHYRWRMNQAQQREDAGLMLRLAGEATRDYEEHTGKRRPLRFVDEIGSSAHKQAVEYLLQNFEGVPAWNVAVEMRTPDESFRNALKWVHRQRAANSRDPETGEMRMTDERTRRIFAMAEAGATQKTIAAEVGLSRQRVAQILAGK